MPKIGVYLDKETLVLLDSCRGQLPRGKLLRILLKSACQSPQYIKDLADSYCTIENNI